MTASKTREILANLIMFDTTSRNSNRPLLDYVIQYLRVYGVEPVLIWNEDHTKANLWATIGPDVSGGLILSGHTDTVPVEGQEWSSDPYVMTERDGLLYGRGTCDMKGFLASVLALVPSLAAAELERPVHLSFSHDEELGCTGVRSLIEHLRQAPVKASRCIVGEPTEMKPVIGHKGGRSYKVHVRGREAHSSLAPQAVNAISNAAELVVFLNSIGERLKSGPIDPLYDVPHSTLSTGIIHGGTAINIVPRDCELVFEYRYLGGVDADAIMSEIREFAERQLLPRMREIAPEASISFDNIYAYPNFEIDPGHEWVSQVKSCAGSNAEAKVAYGTEAGYFSGTLGIATVVCGPGSINQAHRPDEFVSLAQLEACDRFLERMVREIA
jgi:acetylornithine deacetylase